MRNHHVRWLFLFLFGIALIGCQDDLNVNSPVNNQTGSSFGLNKVSPAIETLTKDLDLTGSKIVLAGVGTYVNGTGTFSVNVPAGTIKNVFAYWQGRHRVGGVYPNGDSQIKINGISIDGELIGKANQEGTNRAFVFRADVTSNGFVSTGVNTLSVSDFVGAATLNDRGDGVGIMVVVDDGTKSSVEVRDGADWAYLKSDATYPWLLVTEAQSFTFDAYPVERKADLSLFVGDIGVVNSIPRPHHLEITVGDGAVQSISKPFFNNSGPQWDTYINELTIPAGVTKVKVQLFSDPDEGVDYAAASMVWFLMALKVPAPLSELGDRVWIDNKGGDCNGIQEDGEMGLASVTVNLYKCSDLNTVFKTTTTNADGNYLFSDLVPDCYKVQVMLPTGYAFSTQNAGTDDEKDSDVNSSGWTADINLGAGISDLSNDAGLCPLKSQLGDRVWIDNKGGDCNGIQEDGEMGLKGVTVNLYKCSDLNTVFKTTVTNEDGNYLFTDLDADCYKVEVKLPAGYAFSTQNAGTDDEKDSDVNSSGWTADINLGAGIIDLSNDAGLCPLKSQLGDRVWIDNKGGDCNGIQEDGEMGLKGVTVNLYKCSDLNTVFKTTVTNEDGNYLFTDLDADCYKVEVKLPAGYAFSTQNAGTDDEKDSDVNSSGWTADINLGAGIIDLSNDAGLCPLPSKLGDFVWNDTNKNGVQDKVNQEFRM